MSRNAVQMRIRFHLRRGAVIACGAVVVGMAASGSSSVALPVSQTARPLPVSLLALDWNLTAAEVGVRCTAAIARANDRIGTIMAAAGGPRSFATTVLPFETALADLNDATAAQAFLMNVSADKAVRDASQTCDVAVAAFLSEVSARPAVFRALAAGKDSHTARGPAQLKLTDLWLTQSRRSGAGLPDAARAEFVKLNGQLSALQDQFGANLDNDTSTITITPAQIIGLAPDFVGTLTRQGSHYVVPVNESTQLAFMQNAVDETARHAFYVAMYNRGGTKNVALLEQALAIRDRLAQMFGYPTWAAYVLADKMAQSPERVESFLSTIDTALLPTARAERDELAALKGGKTFESWDLAYFKAMVQKQKYLVDGNEVRTYFPVQHTVDAVLAVYAKLLSVVFTPVAHPNVYANDVLAYAVQDGLTGARLGTFYLDLYPRSGKYDHVANFPIVPRRILPNGAVQPPISIIVGNFPRPSAGSPALLSHADVQTFFHEFGHNMAAMLADEPYETLTSGFRSDFIEAPSQMLENWVWDPGILKQISANVVTGKPLPDALIAKMIAARNVDYALSATQQVLYATVDMAYHTARPPVDTTKIWRTTVGATTVNTFVAGTLPQASFDHLMGGYDAGYYGYLWSQVYAKDLFSAFAAAGLEDPVIGKRYRDDILAPARTYEPDTEVAAFLGRPMNPTAFYRELHIVPPTSQK